MTEPYNLMDEPEILTYDRTKGQILNEGDYVPNVFFAVGFASRCWQADGTFDSTAAIRLANELCAYIRLIGQGKIKIETPRRQSYMANITRWIKLVIRALFNRPTPIVLQAKPSPIVAARTGNIKFTGGTKRGRKRTNPRRNCK